MKSYLIACMDFDVMKEDLNPSDVTFSNPKVSSYLSNQVTSELVDKYRLDLRVNNTTPVIIIALSDSVNTTTSAIIVKSLGNQFNYEALKPYCTYFNPGMSLCIDMLLDNDVHIDPDALMPEWLKPMKKRVSVFAAKL